MLIIMSLLIFQGFSSYSLGLCPTVPIQKDFDIDRFMGLWHQEVRDKDLAYEKGDCNIVEYKKEKENTIRIKSTEIINGNSKTINSVAVCNTNSGQCSQYFFDVPPSRDYKIIVTDYDNISIIYTCSSYLLFHRSYAWILTRKLGTIDLLNYTSFLAEIGIYKENILYTNNQNCSFV